MATYLTHQNVISTPQINKLTISAQLLLIWILYQDTKQCFIDDACQVLPFSHMTLTRAYRQLVHTGLFKEEKNGRKIFLTTSFTHQEVFEKMKKHLRTPIIKKGYILKNELLSQMVESNLTLLSQISMLNTPWINTYAIDKKYKNEVALTKELVDPNQQIAIEIWDYDPLIFSKNKKQIDFLSLVISMLDENDERIEIEIEKQLHNMWRKDNDRN